MKHVDMRLIIAMGLGGLCVFSMAVMLYRFSYKPTWVAFALSTPGMICALSLGGLSIAVATFSHRYRRIGESNPKESVRSVVVGGMVLAGILIVGEVGLRFATVMQPWGEKLGSVPLLPRGWGQVVVRYKYMLDVFKMKSNYFVEDSVLGWTVGFGRSSENGLWNSSAEGVRSPTRGAVYSQNPVSCRIALLGDSFTFGWQATYEETWGASLQEQLGASCQVLNFAVPGYSIGQMYLRYERDVTAWEPDVVVLSFTNGAPERTMGIYCFLMMPDWECPWAAPRFSLDKDRLELLNVPLSATREIYQYRAIYDLPHIEYDWWYRPWQWEQPYWGLIYSSYLFRLATSYYPLYEFPRPEATNDRMQAINEALLQAFVEKTRVKRSSFLVLYLPGKDDYLDANVEPSSHGLLRSAQLAFIDATPCLGKVPSDQRFRLAGAHYAPEGERAVASCVLPYIKDRLAAMNKWEIS